MSRNYFEFKEAGLKSDVKPSNIEVNTAEFEDFGALDELVR
jgi:hypothetical protein